MVGQPNDTEYHCPFRRGFSDLQQDLVLQKTVHGGGGLKECTDEDNILLLTTVSSDPKLHLQACKGYKYTGLTVAFDGTEDQLICKDAKIFWDEMGMRDRINEELKKLKERRDNGLLKWTFENVQNEIIPYPKRGKYDEGEPEGMEDEAPLSAVAEHEKPWEEDGDDVVEDAAANASDMDEEPCQFDQADWVNPVEAQEAYAPREEDLRCRGDRAAHSNSELSLPNTDHTNMLEFRSKMRAYKDCYDSLRALQSPIAHSLSDTVDRVMHVERKRLRDQSKCPAEVFARMDAMLQVDLTKRRRLQEEYQKAMSHAKEKHFLQKKVAECKGHYKQISQEMKRIEAVVAALSHPKVFSPEMLGLGKPRGGNKEHRHNRYDVLERVRRLGGLTEDQKGQWEFFKTHWDDAQANEHGVGWGQRFAETLQSVLLKMLHGEPDAFSKFVKCESDRVLGTKGALVAPGFTTSTDI